MRALLHPAIEDVTVEGILHALADPARVAIFSQIAGSDCSQNCSTFLEMSERTIPKSTLSQHFKALREAGLIRSERQGVEMHNTARCPEIEKRFPGLVSSIVNAHKIQARRKSKASSGGKRKGAAKARKR
ncbi:MAG TPA: helix-turn-helix domain-containing protein [Chthoniobacterales bacterium]|jgi:DNA-binding transcriptional ArsR family regulator